MKVTRIKKELCILLFLKLILILNCSFAEHPTIPRSIDLGKFDVSDDIPTSWMLAHTPYISDEIIWERKDIPEEIIEKEKWAIGGHTL